MRQQEARREKVEVFHYEIMGPHHHDGCPHYEIMGPHHQRWMPQISRFTSSPERSRVVMLNLFVSPAYPWIAGFSSSAISSTSLGMIAFRIIAISVPVK